MDMRLAITPLIAAVLVVAGCSTDSPPATSQADLDSTHSSSLAPTTTTTPPPSTPAKSPRGHIIKQVGQVAGQADTNGKMVLTFTLDKILVDPKCTDQYAVKPKRGHYIALSFTVKTTADLPADGTTMFTQHDFDVIGPDGVTESEVASPGICMNIDEYFTMDPLAPSSQYRGLIVLDSKNTTGVVAFRPGGVGGWEWAF